MSVISYKCPNCGGELVFDAKEQVYKCPYCLSRFQDLDQAEETENTEEAGKAETEKDGGGVLYSCPSCGAEIVTDDTTAATFCYYCHSPVVLKGRVSGEYLPHSILPFQIDEKEAKKRFLEDVRRKKFVPKAFFSKDQIEKLSGVYFPEWVFDGSMDGRLDARTARIRVWMSRDTEFTETKEYHVQKGGHLTFRNLGKNALKKANHELVEGVLPFDLSKEKEFGMGYLSGFFAERRDLDETDLSELVKGEMRGYGETLLRESIGQYDMVTACDCTFQKETVHGRYVLVPIWTLTYRDRKGSLYYYALNGQNGKVAGKFPLDYGRLAALFFAVMVPVLILCLIGGYFL